MASRIGVLGLSVLLGIYAGYSWYFWPQIYPDPKTMQAMVLSVAFIGAILLTIGICGLGVFLTLNNPKSCDYLIDMDGELRKVVWPQAQPLFDPKAEAWGSTYVVIGCTIFFTVFIWAVDTFFSYSVTGGLLKLLFDN